MNTFFRRWLRAYNDCLLSLQIHLIVKCTFTAESTSLYFQERKTTTKISWITTSYFSFFFNGTKDWACSLMHARQALYHWTIAPATNTKNLCHLSICIWDKEWSMFGLDKHLVTVLSATVSTLEFTLTSQDNNIVKTFSHWQIETRMAGFSRRWHEECLLSFLSPSNQIPNISLFKVLNTEWNQLAQAEHLDPPIHHSTFLFQTNNF